MPEMIGTYRHLFIATAFTFLTLPAEAVEAAKPHEFFAELNPYATQESFNPKLFKVCSPEVAEVPLRM
jgi:hypothetical protein